MKKTIRLIILTLIAIAIISCDGSVMNKYFGVPAESITFTLNTAFTYLDRPTKLTITPDPVNATDTYTWTSSDETVATVDDNGMVTGLKNGTVTITATTSEGKTATCEVRVCGYSDCVTFSSDKPFYISYYSTVPDDVCLYGSGDKTKLLDNQMINCVMVAAEKDEDNNYYFYLCGRDNRTFSEGNAKCTCICILDEGGYYIEEGQVDCFGNIMALLDYKGQNTSIEDHTFLSFFNGCEALVNVDHLVFPENFIAEYCYFQMFNSCLNLQTAPVLPATELKDNCYLRMFSGCENLEEAPSLPAEDLAVSCYSEMFSGCKKLKKAPSLPAKELKEDCYSGMFQSCTGLTAAPKLPATTLVKNCYSGMFSGCTGLTAAPELPATTLAETCYQSMFSGCTGLTTAPALPVMTLETECYQSMFYGCTNLTTAPTLPATTLAESCYNSMFQNCFSLTTAPALPATTLAKSCYNSMFYGCKGLTTAPALQATTLVTSCYQSMFRACTSLNINNDGSSSSGTAFFTCPNTSPQECVLDMFTGTATYTSDPVAGDTYYYYTD